MIGILVVAIPITVVALHLFGSPTCGCGSNTTTATNASGVHFTIIMSLNGFNDSKTHGLPWPIMNVTVGQTVLIHLVNCDKTQAHGFSIGIGQSPIYVKPVTVDSGQCLDVSFLATTAGTYIVQCTIFCTVHFWMLNGKLNVNP